MSLSVTSHPRLPLPAADGRAIVKIVIIGGIHGTCAVATAALMGPDRVDLVEREPASYIRGSQKAAASTGRARSYPTCTLAVSRRHLPTPGPSPQRGQAQ
jgi:hypothetical protein